MKPVLWCTLKGGPKWVEPSVCEKCDVPRNKCHEYKRITKAIKKGGKG